MSLNGLYFGNPYRDAILLLHNERTSELCNSCCFSFFFSKIRKLQKVKTVTSYVKICMLTTLYCPNV